MDSSFPNKFFRKPASATALVGLLAVCSLPAAQEGEQPPPISLEAESSTFDRQADMIEFRGLTITQGDLLLEADRALATGLDFGASTWQLTGSVSLEIASALLRADSATFSFDAHQLTMAELRGTPATFTDRAAEREQPVSGGANTFSYDYLQSTLRMSDNAWLSMGPNEIRGCDLIYDFDQGQVTSGTSDCGERFSITIQPPEDAATDSDSSP
jgi:lipopolysaccharide transport protein LptA